MVHYGFGQNMWDIVPMDNITKAYKVGLRFCILEVNKLLTCFLLALFRFYLGIQSSHISCKNIRLSFLAANLPVCRVSLRHVYHDCGQCRCRDRLDPC